MRGQPHTAATRAKLSAQKRGARNPQFGKPRPAEVRRRIAEALKGRLRPMSVKIAISRKNAGEGHGMAKLSWQDVCEIRAAYRAGEVQRVLGERFGISQQEVSDIVRRKLWLRPGRRRR